MSEIPFTPGSKKITSTEGSGFESTPLKVMLIPKEKQSIYEPLRLPIIAENVTATEFGRFLEEKYRDGYRAKYFLLRNGLLIASDNYQVTPAHEKTVVNIVGQLVNFNLQQTNDFESPLDVITHRIEYEGQASTPDVTIRLRGSTVPSVIVEVMYANDGLNQVRNYAAQYLSPGSSIEMFIAIQIIYPGDVANRDQFRACSFVYRRENPDIPIDIISFGTLDLQDAHRVLINQLTGADNIRGCGPQFQMCTEAHNYFIDIPWKVMVVNNEDLLGNIPWNIAQNNHGITVDMYRIQRALARAFQEMPELSNRTANELLWS